MILNLKKISKIAINLTIAFVAIFSLFTSAVLAQTADPTLLAPLPGTYTTCIDAETHQQVYCTKLDKYLPGVFLFSMAIAAIMAFAMITFGGIQYMTSDAISGKQDGKDRVTNAIYGLLLVIGAWAILNTINPNILHFDLNVNHVRLPEAGATVTSDGGPTSVAPSVNVGGNIAGVPMTPSQIATSNAVLSRLNPTAVSYQITPYQGLCLNGQTVGCVDLNGIQQPTITGLQTLRNSCSCNISITGGTEAGHSTNSCHNSGTCVDIAASAKINNLITSGAPLVACKTYYSGAGNYLYEPVNSTCGGEVASSGEHWHAVYN